MPNTRNPIPGLLLLALLWAGAIGARAEDSAWVQLFNGRDLTDWDIKFTKHPLNDNYNNTFKVVDGVLTVDYSGWSTFGEIYGHAINKTRTYSYYLLRAEYQVGAQQVSGGPGWANQNNGLMLHSQSMATMTTNQDFPISLEAQLLGPANGNSTMNLCTPGTGFYTARTGGSVNATHCVVATPSTRPATGVWTWVSASVMADSIIRHYTGPNPTGTPVLTYYRTVYLKGNILNPPSGTPADGEKLGSGYIAIQAESHPWKFRKIEVLDLEGCTEKTSPSYRTYFVKSKAGACGASTGLGATTKVLPRDIAMTREPSGFSIRSPKAGTLEITDPSGKVLGRANVDAGVPQYVQVARKGVCLVIWRSGATVASVKWIGL